MRSDPSVAAFAMLVLMGGCDAALDQSRHPASSAATPAAAIAPATPPRAMGTTTTTQSVAPAPQPAAAPAPAAAAPGPAATADFGQPQPLPGLAPVPKPFVAIGGGPGHPAEPAKPSTLLLEHASPEPPVPLSEYGTQPVHGLDDFPLGPMLTGAAVRRRFGPPAGLAGVEDPWAVYRLTFGRELWLHFADGDGPLTAADLVRGAESGYVRDRLYPSK